MEKDDYYMSLALEEARIAAQEGEVPIGAVIVRNGIVIAKAHNEVEAQKSGTAHAEMLALQRASRALNAWRLDDCTLYVSKEPCPMCAGAMVNCRLMRVVYGCKDTIFGAAGSRLNVASLSGYIHSVQITSGIMADEALEIIQTFFRNRRKQSHTS